MSKNLHDKIKGSLYGCAYGDTLGLGTEFMTKAQAKRYYPDGLRKYSDIIRDSHRSQWQKGEWTNDTMVFLFLLEDGIKYGNLDLSHVAARMHKWAMSHPLDLQPFHHRVMTHADFPEHPLEVSARLWEDGDHYATNEAIIHSVVAAYISDDEHFRQDACNLTNMTHHDKKCEACGVIAAKIARDLLFYDKDPNFDEIIDLAERVDTRVIPYIEIAHSGTLADLDLDDDDSVQFCRKSLASALWALWHCNNAADMIHCLIDEGGDSDTNAALAGIYAGLKFGYDAIPAEKEHIINKEQIDALAESLTTFLENKQK